MNMHCLLKYVNARHLRSFIINQKSKLAPTEVDFAKGGACPPTHVLATFSMESLFSNTCFSLCSSFMLHLASVFYDKD